MMASGSDRLFVTFNVVQKGSHSVSDIDIFDNTWVLKYPSGEYVALDTASGGYPYKASYPGAVKFWSTFEDANKYSMGFPKVKFTIHRVNGLYHTAAITEGDFQ